MNIFVVDEDPLQAARDLCNKHVVKMIVESTQNLSTVMHIRGIKGPYAPYKPNDKCVQWVHLSVNNALWLLHHTVELTKEYEKRYNKTHATLIALNVVINKWGEIWGTMIGNHQLHTPFVQQVPQEYKRDNPIEAYRAYYVGEKRKFAKWQPRTNPPSWWEDL